MTPTATAPRVATRLALLGDEAVARAAIDAGISAAYAYPGTPATEINEALLHAAAVPGGPKVAWCANEKTAFEQALGVSFAGGRALVSMKHVGLNVAADPFVNAALLGLRGGLVLAVADDPGMHSSQNEQDSRFYADFAKVPCLEPSSQQEAYDMTREAFHISERFCVPVMVRLVTRLAHSRAAVATAPEEARRPATPAHDPARWVLLPSNARRQWRALLDRQHAIKAWSEASRFNLLSLNPGFGRFGVITTGLARNYYLENLPDMPERPSHLHIGASPMPVELIRTLAAGVGCLVILEEGAPLVERHIRGVLPIPMEIRGRLSGHLPPDGELNPDIVRPVFDLSPRPRLTADVGPLPARPPQLCPGCAHRDAFAALKQALAGEEKAAVNSDIGCYTLGALPPFGAIESCVCMGASVGMAKGASDAGLRPTVGVIGDSTFLHSGITPLMDAVAADTDMTLIILDNGTVAMTGGQPTVLPDSSLEPLVRGLGVPAEHCHVLRAHPKKTDEMARVMRQALDHKGLDVIIVTRECLETARRRKKKEASS